MTVVTLKDIAPMFRYMAEAFSKTGKGMTRFYYAYLASQGWRGPRTYQVREIDS